MHTVNIMDFKILEIHKDLLWNLTVFILKVKNMWNHPIQRKLLEHWSLIQNVKKQYIHHHHQIKTLQWDLRRKRQFKMYDKFFQS